MPGRPSLDQNARAPFANWLKQSRIARGMTQEQLRELVGLKNRVSVVHYESKQQSPSSETRAKIEEVLGVRFPDVVEPVPAAEPSPSQQHLLFDGEILVTTEDCMLSAMLRKLPTGFDLAVRIKRTG
jgi:transcriptional regulator with XRE-family HTH domain